MLNVGYSPVTTLEGFRGRTTQICLENEDMGGGWDRESHQKLSGGITSVK